MNKKKKKKIFRSKFIEINRHENIKGLNEIQEPNNVLVFKKTVIATMFFFHPSIFIMFTTHKSNTIIQIKMHKNEIMNLE